MTHNSEDRLEALYALERRVDELESRVAIEALHSTFVRAVADREFDTLADYFVSDATIDMRTHGVKQGTAAIAEHFSHMVNTPLTGASYLLSSPVVQVVGDRATGTWTWHRFHSTATVVGKVIPVWGIWEEGQYNCEYRRGANGSWRFSRMRFRMVRPDPDPEGEPTPDPRWGDK